MNTLSRQAPRPSMLIWQPRALTVSTNTVAVNWLPWPVLTMSGAP